MDMQGQEVSAPTADFDLLHEEVSSELKDEFTPKMTFFLLITYVLDTWVQ